MVTAHYDGGNEFKDQFEKFLQDHHVHYKTSTPETPEENSLIERQIGNAKQGTRALLHKANHPTPMWDRAMAVWVAHYNDEQKDSEKLGLKLRVKLQYGQRVIVKKHDTAHTDTFDPKGKSAIFIGYSEYGILTIDETKLWKTFRVVIETYSTFTTPVETVFPGFPEIFLLNKDEFFR